MDSYQSNVVSELVCPRNCKGASHHDSTKVQGLCIQKSYFCCRFVDDAFHTGIIKLISHGQCNGQKSNMIHFSDFLMLLCCAVLFVFVSEVM